MEPVAALDLIISQVQLYLERRGGAAVVDVDCVASVVAEISRDDDDIAKESILVFSAFKMPKLRYDVPTRLFLLETDASKRSLHASAHSKIDLLRER
jgi:hypothetical protein